MSTAFPLPTWPFPETLGEILTDQESSVIDCFASSVEVYIEFTAPIVSAAAHADEIDTSVSISGNSVLFTADSLVDSPAEFVIWLDTCGTGVGNGDDGSSDVVTAFTYVDDEDNNPDVTNAESPRQDRYSGTFANVSGLSQLCHIRRRPGW